MPFLADDWVDDNDRIGDNQVFANNQVVLYLVVNKDWVISNHRVNNKDLVRKTAQQSAVEAVVKAGRAARPCHGHHGGKA